MKRNARQSAVIEILAPAGTEHPQEESSPALAHVAPLHRHSAINTDAVQSSDPAETHGRARRNWIIGLVVAIVAAIAWSATRKSEQPPATANAAAAPAPLELASVDLIAVQPRVLARSLPLSGSIAPVVQATVKSKVSGDVEMLSVREGQDVREGDVIARIDTRNLQAQYDREMAAVEKARADLELATLNRDKNRMLLEQKYISQNTYETTESTYAASVANLKLAEAQARLMKISLDDALVRAPFAGTIAKRLVQPGEKVSQDSPIVTLVDLRQMLLEAAVPAVEIPSVRVGQQVRFKVSGFGAREFVGEVQRINPVASEGSRAITIYVAVANDDGALKGGMFAQGELVLASSDPVLSVPQAAVHSEAGVPFVYTYAGGKIVRTQLTLGDGRTGDAGAEGGFVEVRSGLKQGDRVIVAEIGSHAPGSAAIVRGET